MEGNPVLCTTMLNMKWYIYALVCIWIAGCNQNRPEDNDDPKIVIETLGPVEVAEEMALGMAVLVDVRDAEELDSLGFIPGAIQVSFDSLEYFADSTLAAYIPAIHPDNRIILYCNSGNRSFRAAKKLKRMGFENVAHMDGGIKAWREENLPTD